MKAEQLNFSAQSLSKGFKAMSTARRRMTPCVAVMVCVAAAATSGYAAQPTLEKSSFGKMPDGTEIELYTLDNAQGLRVKIMTYGATIVAVETPDRNGKRENITLAMDSLADYLKGVPYFGATVGAMPIELPEVDSRSAALNISLR